MELRADIAPPTAKAAPISGNRLASSQRESMSNNRSDSRQVVGSWLSQLNPHDPGLLLDQNGLCQLVCDSVANHCIVFVPTTDSETFYLFQDVCHLPEAVGPASYEALLTLNLLGIETRGGMLGFDQQTRNLVFSFSREIATTDVKNFCTVLENFLDAADRLRERLTQLLRTDVNANRPKTATAQRFKRS
jgi:hypothetical protein